MSRSDEMDEVSSSEHGKNVGKRKKKKKKKYELTEEEISETKELSNILGNTETEKIKKKKRKKERIKCDADVKIKSSKKKKAALNSEEEIHPKKKKIRPSVLDDESVQKLKKECNQDDAKVTTNEVAPYAGQWSEANVGSDERKDKFLRLLGGYKASNTNKKEKEKAFSSFAFSKKKEEKLNERLSQQYDSAWEITRAKRGQGLGFDAVKDATDKQPSFSWT